MRRHDVLNCEDAKQAQREATRGAVTGALKWGAGFAVLGVIGYGISPLYRSLTVQFKIYLQMSGMILGGMIEADYRMRQYEARVRVHRRVQRDKAMWDTFEREYQEDGAPPPPPKPKHLRESKTK